MEPYCGFLFDLWANLLKYKLLVLAFPLIIFVNTLVFYLNENFGNSEKNETHGFWLALYVSMITFLTIGYGDFAPKTTLGRIWAVLTGIAGVTALGLWVGLILLAMQEPHSTGKHRPCSTTICPITEPAQIASETIRK